eukprot:gene2162-4208_t
MSKQRKQRKKQTVIPFERSSQAVDVDCGYILSINRRDGFDIYGIEVFLGRLSACKDLRLQISTCNECKVKIKTLITSRKNSPGAELSNYYAILLLLYLEPSSHALRKSLEWIPELILSDTVNRQAALKSVSEIFIQRVLGHYKTDIQSIDVCMGLAFTFTCIALLDKDSNCLGNDPMEGSQTLTTRFLGTGMLLEFIKALLRILDICVVSMIPTPNTTATTAATASSGGMKSALSPNKKDPAEVGTATEVMRYAECSGECMRAIVMVFKNRREALVSADDTTSEWSSTIRRVIQVGYLILRSELINKDIVTAASLAVVHCQWLGRYLSCWGGTLNTLAPSLQLVAIMALTDCTERPLTISSSSSEEKVSAKDLHSFAISVGLHADLFQFITTLPVLAKCSIFRSCLHVYDDAALLYTPYYYSNQGIERHVMAVNILKEFPDSTYIPNSAPPESLSLIITSVFAAIMRLCNHSTPTIRLYGLQTFETWIHRLQQLETNFTEKLKSEQQQRQLSSDANHSQGEATAETTTTATIVSVTDISGNSEEDGASSAAYSDGAIQDPTPLPLPLEILTAKIAAVSGLLSRAWSHPSKQVNHMVPTVYQRLVDFAACIENRSGEVEDTNVWGRLVRDALNQPYSHRGRYQALSILLPKVGPERLLKSQPRSLVEAMKVRDVASSACSFAGDFLRAIQPSMTAEAFREFWAPAFMRAICSENLKQRAHSADYLVPEAIKLDPHGTPYLINLIRSMSIVASSTSSLSVLPSDTIGTGMGMISSSLPPSQLSLLSSKAEMNLENCLWGIVHLVTQARTLSLDGRDVLEPSLHLLLSSSSSSSTSPNDVNPVTSSLLPVNVTNTSSSSSLTTVAKRGSSSPSSPSSLAMLPFVEWPQHTTELARNGPLHTHELCWACLSENENLRLAALALLTSSQKTILRMLPHELGILKATLRYSLKTPSADHRQRIMRLMKTLFCRLKETSRVSVKEAKNQRPVKSDKKDKVTDKVTDKGTEKSADKVTDAVSEAAKDALGVCEWLAALAVITLDLLHEALDGLGQDSPYVKPLFTPAITASVLNLFMSSWDRTRLRAAELLMKFPRPLPGFSSPESVSALVMWACRLMSGAKQREADAGATLLRLLLAVYSLHLGWDIDIIRMNDGLTMSTNSVCDLARPANPDDVQTSSTGVCHGDGHIHIPAVSLVVSSAQGGQLIAGLCDVLEARLRNLRGLFMRIPENRGVIGASKSSPKSIDTTAATASPMCHGIVSALRNCLEEVYELGLLRDEGGGGDTPTTTSNSRSNSIASAGDNVSGNGSAPRSKGGTRGQWAAMRELWGLRVQRSVKLAMEGFRVALTVVAEGDKGDEQSPQDAAGAAKGPIHANAYMFINTNGYMESEGGEDRGTAIQRAIVAAWLLLKECAALLSKLIQMSPPADSNNNTSTNTKPSSLSSSSNSKGTMMLLDDSTIEMIGEMLLDSLGRLRHLGAISEAHTALQTVCETLLRYGDRNNELCRLPMRWLQQSLAQLRGERQSFILRRSAGFAYAFMALLRAEPGNIKPTLLPEAMRALLQYAAVALTDGSNTSATDKGAMCDIEGVEVGVVEGEQSPSSTFTLSMTNEKDTGDDDGDHSSASVHEEHWKTSVHALNIIRLILLDGALGPDLDQFIAQATILAVRGFKSPRWAVRNSSMMVFASVVQRSVDNDKNDTGGGRPPTTAYEFFHCFPSLFPFLLQELATISGFDVAMDVDGWPVSVTEKSQTQSQTTEGNTTATATTAAAALDVRLHPSLYPLLLLLSKLRASMLGSTPTSVEGGDDKDTVDGLHQADISLFLPMVSRCANQRVEQVRGVAARAMASLISLRQVPQVIPGILQRITVGLMALRGESNGTPPTPRMSYNEVHGLLLQVQELLKSVLKMADKSEFMVFLDELRFEILTSVVPQLQILLPLLTECCCPPIQLILCRVLKQLTTLCPCGRSWKLLGRVCEAVLSDAVVIKDSAISVHTPCSPILWRETLTELLPLVVRGQMDELCINDESMSCVSSSSTTLLDGRSLVSHALDDRGMGLDHPADTDTDGVRKASGDNNITTNTSCSNANNSNINTNNNTICYPDRGWAGSDLVTHCTNTSLSSLLSLLWHPISEVREGVLCGCQTILERDSSAANVLLDEGLLNFLLTRLHQETEPPLLQITSKLLCFLTRRISFRALDESVKILFRGAWVCFENIVKGTRVAGSDSPKKTPVVTRDAKGLKGSAGVGAAAGAGGGLLSFTYNEEDAYDSVKLTTVEVAPVLSAASALEVMGWVVDGCYEHSSNENDDGMEDTMSRLHSWVALMEGAAQSSQTVVVREASARALCRSKLLERYACLACQAASSLVGFDAPSSEYACRLWLLALQLMQDDDSDVRSVCNAAVSDASNALMIAMPQQMQRVVMSSSISSCFANPTPLLTTKTSVTSNSMMWMTETLPIAPGMKFCQGRVIECMSPCLALVIAWSAASGSTEDRGWGKGARAMLEGFHMFSGSVLETESLLRGGNGFMGSKIFEKDQDNLFTEAVISSAVLAAALGSAVSLLQEPQASLLWKPILFRAEKAMEFLRESMEGQRQGNVLQNMSKLGGLCFHPDFFCFVFSSLRAASEVARAGRPSSEFYSALSRTQLHAREILQEYGSNLNSDGDGDGEMLIHPKIYQLIVCLSVPDE